MSGQPSRSKSTIETDAPIDATSGMMRIQFGIERRRLVNEVDARGVGNFLQIEAVPRQRRFRIGTSIAPPRAAPTSA